MKLLPLVFIAMLFLHGCFMERPAKECKWYYAPDGCYEPYVPPAGQPR